MKIDLTARKSPETMYYSDIRHAKNQNKLSYHLILFSLTTSLLLSLFSPFIADAAILSIATKQTIQGSSPYFTFDNKTKAVDLTDLVTLKLSDGTILTKNSNPTSAKQPIELPVIGQTFANVDMFIPKTAMQMNLNDLVQAPYNYAQDDNGDSEFSATGSLSVEIIDVNGNKITNRATSLESCKAPYKVIISSSGSSLKTGYGSPNSRNYGEVSAIYYFKPKSTITVPTSCYAKPNLSRNGFDMNDKSYDGPASQWNNREGFLLQDLNNASTNFPTMGAGGLYFNLSFFNAHSSTITYEKSPANSGIDLTISTVNDNTVKVMLTGPRNGATINQANSAVPTTFILKAGATPIYSFKISKWFIVKPGVASGYFDFNYCRNSYGVNYRFPNTNEFTNANGNDWSNGLSGQPNHYQRRIGGGLFAEWGNLHTGYTNTDFKDDDYYAAEKFMNEQRVVNAYDGNPVHYGSASNYIGYGCVK